MDFRTQTAALFGCGRGEPRILLARRRGVRGSFGEGIRADDGDAAEVGLSGAGVRAVDGGTVVGVEVEADALCEEGEVSWKTETKNLRRLQARVFSGCLNDASPKFVGDRVCSDGDE